MANAKVQKLAGSCDQNAYIRGLLLASKNNSLGEMWERCVDCHNCIFAKQCNELGECMEDSGKNPTCGQIVDILLGDLDPDDVAIQKLPVY